MDPACCDVLLDFRPGIDPTKFIPGDLSRKFLRTIAGSLPLDTPEAMIGTRVPIYSSPDRGSAIDPGSLSPPLKGAKIREVWARFGLGHVQSPSRYKRIKRAWKQACRRALREEHTEYHGRTLYGPLKFQ